MVDTNIATAAEQPINRHAAVAGEEMEEGDLVGINSSGQMVQATADPNAPITPVGVCMTPAVDPSNYSDEVVQDVVSSNRAVVGRDRVTAVSYGVEIENSDDDWDFIPGIPVFLTETGGFAQTRPSSSGAIIVLVGIALTEERVAFNVTTTGETSA